MMSEVNEVCLAGGSNNKLSMLFKMGLMVHLMTT